jgi:amino-acid N-acetyltransferase
MDLYRHESFLNRPMTIQPASPDDFETVWALLQRVGLPHDDLTPAHLQDFLAAREGGSLRGVVGLEAWGEVALLRSLAVPPGARNEGLGARLVTAIEQRAKDKGVHTLYLLTTTAADYFRARGYERIARDALPEAIQQTEEAARLCPASATCMRKSLRTPTESRDQPDSDLSTRTQ